MVWSCGKVKSSRRRGWGVSSKGTVTRGTEDTDSSSSSRSADEKYHLENTFINYQSQQSPEESLGVDDSSTATKNNGGFESIECVYGSLGVDPFEGRDDMESTLSPATQSNVQPSSSPSSTTTSGGCECGLNTRFLPQLEPEKWPQAPLLLRPKPDGGTKILGIRKEGSQDQFLWKPGQQEQWWAVLGKTWASNSSRTEEDELIDEPQFCEHCVILPINNGMEKSGEALVVDFESQLFLGTLMLRLRESNGTLEEPYKDELSFFADQEIRYQAVLRGQFKKELPFSDMLTGNLFRRPFGKIPPKFVMWAATKIIQFFAPQLHMKVEKCDRPSVLSPFGSAPRVIIVEDAPTKHSGIMTNPLSEPQAASKSILKRENPLADPLERSRARKKQMDQAFMAKCTDPMSDPSKLYTFEFLQHLLDYQKFQINLSQSIHVGLKEILDGQPLQLMAGYKKGERTEKMEESLVDMAELFAFEIWHTCLWEDAKSHLGCSS